MQATYGLLLIQSYAPAVAVETEPPVETITAAVAIARSPVRKLVMFVVPSQAALLLSVPLEWELTGILYVRDVTSARATDNSTGQDRPITSCGDLCKAWPMSIRGTASKIINILIITSWS